MVSDSNWDVYNVGRSCDTGSSVNTVGEFDLTTNDNIHDPYTTAQHYNILFTYFTDTALSKDDTQLENNSKSKHYESQT